MTKGSNYLDIHFGDEVVIGPLKGVRFWVYYYIDPFGNYSPYTIRSFQHYIDWNVGQAAQSDYAPTMENGRGLNVYKTIEDAMRGSADAVNAVIEDAGVMTWHERQRGLVLGEVEFWGPAIEWPFGYHAQYVKPTRFLQAWGYKREQIVDELNNLWFEDNHE